MNGRECKRKFTNLVRELGALAFVEHALAQDVVGPSLVVLAPLLQPDDHVGVEAHGYGLL